LEKAKDIKGLAKALEYKKETRVKNDAVYALARIKDPRVVEPLIGALKKARHDNGFRLIIKEILIGIGGTRVAELIIQELEHKEPQIREIALSILAENKEYDELTPFIVALKDEDKYVRHTATKALRKEGNKIATGPLIAALKDDYWEVAEEAAWALGEMREPRATDSLIEALKYPEGHVVTAAMYALGELREGSAVEPLIHTLFHSSLADLYMNSVAYEALWKIVNKEKKFQARCAKLLVEEEILRRRAGLSKCLDILVKIGEPAIEPLCDALKDKRQKNPVYKYVGEALARIKDLRAVEPLIGVLKQERDRYYQRKLMHPLYIITEQKFETPEEWDKWWELNKENLLKRK